MAERRSITTVADLVAHVRDGRLEDLVKEVVALVVRESMEAEIGTELSEVARDRRTTHRNSPWPRASETGIGEFEPLITKKRSGQLCFLDLNRYEATQRFNRQGAITLDGDRATAASYCTAHHLFTDGTQRNLMVTHLRYDDTFGERDGVRLSADRNLAVDSSVQRAP
jgi:hypothetical protein